MARGFLGGALLGGAFSLGAALIASVIVPLPQPVGQQPQVPDSDVQQLAQPAPVETDMTAPSPGGDTVIGAAEVAPQVTAPERDTLSGISEEPPRPATAPVLAEVKPLEGPSSVPEAGGLEVSGEDPVLPNPQALAPMAPPPADEVVAETETAAPPVQAEPQEEADATVAETEEAAAPVVETADEAPVESAAEQTDATQTEVVEAGRDEAEKTETVQIAQAPASEAPSEEAEAPPQPSFPTVTADEDLPAESETAEVAPETPQDAEEEAPQVAMVVPSARPQIGTPATNLADRNTGVVVNRLGRSAEVSEEVTNVTVITEEGGDGSIESLQPIRRYAASFDNPDDKPLMSIVLIDAGTGPTTGEAGLAALRSFPYPLTFAVDSSLPDAETRMALYREAGFEVMALVDLPQGAQATDAETTLGVVLSQLREVVGVMEGPGTGLQGSRAVSDQVTAILAQSGHGLVTQDKGLNTFPKLAVKEGVPAAPVFRDFDSKGQTAVVIRRFLDQAAFKAGQEGAVIMLGRLRPDTISALLLWGLQDRAGTVALAPISAVLTREAG